MSAEACKNHKLKYIMYAGQRPDIPVLTFEFTNGVISPPKGTYTMDFWEKELVDPNQHVAIFEIETYRDRFGYWTPYQLRLWNNVGEMLIDITRPFKKNVEKHPLYMNKFEHIVSVSIDAHYWRPIIIEFMVYNCA